MADEKKNDVKKPPLSEIFQRPWSLVALGIFCVIFGFLSATGKVSRTIFYVKPDYIVLVGLISIVVGLLWRKKKL